ncbi:histone-lysine N-methyltransferase SETMAR-like [Oppia nitens]|uniref:histone-lysine N-methyltransferase SETMAR-like n=1 Tax=Oppia nitens TaxID=1686743 RepID=UPI0023DCBA65|nr:histone-lysine N-methyltransferase SETMAR-like [Oppia nitens]
MNQNSDSRSRRRSGGQLIDDNQQQRDYLSDLKYTKIVTNIIVTEDNDLDDKDLCGCRVDCRCCDNQWPEDINPEEEHWCQCSQSRCDVDFNYDTNGLLMNFTKPIHECGDNCFCNSSDQLKIKCWNRYTQRQIIFNTQLFIHPIKGYGLRTLSDLKTGQFVTEYCGEVIDRIEAYKRFGEQNEEKHNYILIFREHFGKDIIFEVIIDAKYYGNDSRFINHSCDPNLIALPVRSDSLRPRICLFAIKDITSGTELSYNYGSNDSPLSTKKCFCGFQKCRGFMPKDNY